MSASVDVLVIGAGHNGLVAAVLLAQRGLSVTVLEDQPVLGGATRTEQPFAKAPQLKASTGAYLLGLMPPEVLAATGVDIPVIRRDPHYFLPTMDGRYLLFGSNEADTKRQLVSFFSEADWKAHEAMQRELAQLREDVGPTWLAEPLSIEATAERYVRAPLRSIFVDLCRKSVGDYLDRFGWKSDLLRAMYAVTDGFSGVNGSWDTPGTGMNFLVHNMCRLPGSGGTWMIARGGMGAVSKAFADKARAHGAKLEAGAGVEKILFDGGGTTRSVRGVLLKDGRELKTRTIVCNADPFRMRQMIGAENLPADYNARLDGYRKDGTTLKVNLALRGLPKFTCLPEDRGQLASTIHLLPDEQDVMRSLREGYEAVQEGQLAELPAIEWYIHTTVDPSLRDAAGHHSSALFVQWVPYELKGTSWDKEQDKYVAHLLSICDRFAPGTSELVVDKFALSPVGVEKHFGITRGHIHHVDNSFGFSDRLPYATPLAGLYSCSSGTHPAGAVIGAAGHNAAMRVLKDLGRR